MMKSQLINIILISITLFKYVTSVDIECDFKSDDFDVITDQYTCEVQNILMIKSKNVVIQTFRGSHNFGKTSSDVTGLTINDKKIQFMPKNLDERFKNLVAIKIRQGRLKEISRDDLKGFKKLKYLNLDSNDIATLDDDIFEFNPQLEIIWFEGNRIKNIGMSVFDNLKNLNDLDLNGNACISKRMSNNRGMAEFLKEVKKNCFDAALELDKLKQKYMNVNAKNLGALNSSEVEAAKTVNANKLNAQKLTDCNNFEVEELKIVVRNVTDLMKNKEKDAEEKLTKLNSKVKEKDEKLKKFEEKLANLTTLQTQPE